MGKKRSCRLKWVSQLIDGESRRWKDNLLHRYFHDHDVEVIKKIQIPWRPADDFVAWHWEKSGCFSVRSAYRLAVDLRDLDSQLGASSGRPDGHRPVWKKFWALSLPHKVRIFCWKLIQGGLATKSNKRKRNLETVDTCDICGIEGETEYHML